MLHQETLDLALEFLWLVPNLWFDIEVFFFAFGFDLFIRRIGVVEDDEDLRYFVHKFSILPVEGREQGD